MPEPSHVNWSATGGQIARSRRGWQRVCRAPANGGMPLKARVATRSVALQSWGSVPELPPNSAELRRNASQSPNANPRAWPITTRPRSKTVCRQDSSSGENFSFSSSFVG